VSLLGDSAHPMLPFLGLGAAMAIEDAVVLGRAFKQAEDPRAALALYEGARSERAGKMILESRHQGDIFRDGPNSTRVTPMTNQERMNYDPSTAPL
jgi:salicylate hydroxylase